MFRMSLGQLLTRDGCGYNASGNSTCAALRNEVSAACRVRYQRAYEGHFGGHIDVSHVFILAQQWEMEQDR
jgi:hypothetical protein